MEKEIYVANKLKLQNTCKQEMLTSNFSKVKLFHGYT